MVNILFTKFLLLASTSMSLHTSDNEQLIFILLILFTLIVSVIACIFPHNK